MTGSLSTADVARLMADPSAASRAALAAKLGRELDNPGLAPAGLAHAQDIVRLLARDVEVAVRAALSDSLQHTRHLPHEVAVQLAADVEAVALPILGTSLVLTDDDLVAIIRGGSPARHAAIAARPTVAEPVADALIDHGNEATVTTLMANAGARITESGLNRAMDRFGDSETVKAGMAHRPSLPLAVVERLVVAVSGQLRDHLIAHHDLPPAMICDLILGSRERAVIRLSLGSAEADLRRMVSQMHHGGRLTPSLILRALCTGDIVFFEVAIAVLAKVPVANARILIHDPGRAGLASLYARAGLPQDLFPAVRAAVDVVEETGFDGAPHDLERYRARVITRVLTQLETLDPADLDYLVDKLGDMLAVAA